MIVSYEQFPYGTDINEDVLKKVGAEFITNNRFKVQSEITVRPVYPIIHPDTITTLTAENLVSVSKKIGPTMWTTSNSIYSLGELLEDVGEDYIQKAYKILVSAKDLKYAKCLPLFKNVRWLEIEADYNTDSIPEEIGKLDKLIYLRIKGYQGKNSSTQKALYIDPIKNLKNLTHLRLTTTHNKQLPTWFENFVHLKNLYLDGAYYEYTGTLGKLSNLEELTIWGSSNETLPVEVKNLTKLKDLKLIKFTTKIDNAILPSLVNLKKLAIQQHANEFPNFTNCHAHNIALYQTIESNTPIEGLDKANNLDTLVLTYKSKLFPDLSACPKLKKLTINNHVIEVLPPSLCNITNLEDLGIDSKSLVSLPDNIENLRKLKMLRIRAKLITLPDVIGNLKKLPGSYIDGFRYVPADSLK